MYKFIKSNDDKTIPIDTLDGKKNYIDGINLINSNIDKVVIRSITKELAEKYCLVPFKICKDEIHIAMNDITDIEAIDNIKFITHKKVITYKSKKEDLLLAINFYYEKEDAENILRTIENKNNIQLEYKTYAKQ